MQKRLLLPSHWRPSCTTWGMTCIDVKRNGERKGAPGTRVVAPCKAVAPHGLAEKNLKESAFGLSGIYIYI